MFDLSQFGLYPSAHRSFVQDKVARDQRARSARIAATDVLASNGVIHVIDKVILPRP